ncbi:MAG: hypothetical protein KGJ60_00245 [Verrucomicrobiota bacterium]|nr:hypothetical protein [Verrucomicrobiota bacterium]
MRPLCVTFIVAGCWFALASGAQEATNAPKTEIENFEAQTNAVIIKGFGQVGSVTTDAGVISVRCKESDDVSAGRKAYGLTVVFDGNRREHEREVVDDDEMDSLLNGLDYLGKITYDATPLPGFEATYTTRSGLRIVAYSSRRQSGIQKFLEFGGDPRISLTPDQLAQFQKLIEQAKKTLDSLKAR